MAKKEEKRTKAVLFTKGEGQPFETFEGSIDKESFSEYDYDKSVSTNSFGPDIIGLQSVNTNDTFKVGEQEVYALAFEDGKVYVAGKGFIDGEHKEAVEKAVKDLAPKPEAKKESTTKKPEAKKEEAAKAEDKKEEAKPATKAEESDKESKTPESK